MENGNEYNYFQVDKTNGNIGLLEVLARKHEYVATIMSLTEVEVVKVDSAIIYELIMSDSTVMRRCTVLLAGDLYKRSGNDGLLYYFSGIDRLRYYLVSYYDMHKADGKQRKVIVEEEYQDIASKIGVSTRTVGRSVHTLKENGEIQSQRKKIVISGEQYQVMLQKIYT